MRYLLDVSALVAFGFLEHEFHKRVAVWIDSQASAGETEFLACSITELGFVRVLSQASQYGFTVSTARSLLMQLKSNNSARLTFVADHQDISQLPSWVTTGKQITDGDLAELAEAHEAVLATLHAKIPRSFLIPSGR
jgi:uncharacterized protein